MQNFRVPGILYGRVIRPTAIGARHVSVDESPIRSIPEVRIVSIERFFGVVARN
jgi:nicotinate dehydrogenase subunit B